MIINLANPGLCHGTGLNRSVDGSVAGFVFDFLGGTLGYSCAVGARRLTDAAANYGEEIYGE